MSNTTVHSAKQSYVLFTPISPLKSMTHWHYTN